MDQSVQVVERVFAVLEYLSQAREPKGPTDIADATGISKSTVYRLLISMGRLGYIERRGSNGKYGIGIKLIEIVSNHINNLELQTEARPYLHELQNEIGLTVHLGILEGREVIYVEKLDINRNLRLYTQIGMRVPAYCSSLGKCLLSCLSGDDLDYLYGGRRLERYTPNTIADYPKLKEHLREVRLKGWAMDDEEYILGNRCVAAPVYDYRGEMIAAISASGPASLLTTERVPEIVKHVRHTASCVSRSLCYQDT